MRRQRKNAKLRVCASCEWVFWNVRGNICPQCGFVSYGAHYVYGKKAYEYPITQEPWLERKLNEYRNILQKTIIDPSHY